MSFFFFSEEKRQIQKAILSCSLTGGGDEAMEDELESEEEDGE